MKYDREVNSGFLFLYPNFHGHVTQSTDLIEKKKLFLKSLLQTTIKSQPQGSCKSSINSGQHPMTEYSSTIFVSGSISQAVNMILPKNPLPIKEGGNSTIRNTWYSIHIEHCSWWYLFLNLRLFSTKNRVAMNGGQSNKWTVTIRCTWKIATYLNYKTLF